MMRAFSAAVSGLRTHQTYLDAVANDIANVNTLAYKSSRFSFKDAFNQTLRNSGGPGTVLGSVNPQQVGLGVEIGSVDNQMGQGPITSTGNPFDMAIQGDGFFRVSKQKDPTVMSAVSGNFFTRAGNFTLSTVDASSDGTHIAIIAAKLNDSDATQIDFTLDPGVTKKVGETFDIATGTTVTDGTATPFDIGGTYTVTASNGTTLTVTRQGGVPSGITATVISFDTASKDKINDINVINEAGAVLVTQDGYYLVGYAADTATPPTISPITTSVITLQVPASARSVNVDQNGLMSYISSSGETEYVGFVALAKFPNPQGLERVSANLWQSSQSSGAPVLAAPTQQGTGSITSRALEMSNVDISFEFAEMIKAQRGFQVNSRTITTADDMLQTLVQMKR